ncbi:MAG: hypothetical protein IAF02_20085 [Anaerolineae bacterium]|nr:hypothetical protein [Anaerolineae bacterium]
MSFTYGDEAPALLNLLRDEIDDTQENPKGVFPDGRNFSDARLTEILLEEAQIIGRFTARCCEILSRAYARFPTQTRLGPTGETIKAFEYYRGEAARLRRLHGHTQRRRGGATSVPLEVRL